MYCLYIYLGDCQHSFDYLIIVSNRQNPEIAAKESERQKKPSISYQKYDSTNIIITILVELVPVKEKQVENSPLIL